MVCIIADVVVVLTDSVDPGGYIKDMRRRDEELFKGWGQIATPLSVPTEGGPQRINCGNTEGIFRIIRSIPSPKSEPFKRWLAKVGYERVQESCDLYFDPLLNKEGAGEVVGSIRRQDRAERNTLLNKEGAGEVVGAMKEAA